MPVAWTLMNMPIREARFSPTFVAVAALFITLLLTSNIIAAKAVPVCFGWFLPSAIIIFPLSYIFGDILTEVYGYRQARLIIWLGFICNLLMVVSFWAAGQLPYAPFGPDEKSYNAMLGSTPRILGASFLAYLVGEFTNSAVLSKMKVAMGGKLLWARTIGSTVIGQGLDSAIFISLSGIFPAAAIPTTIAVQWAVKVGYEIIATPFTYAIVAYLKKKEATDAFDRDVSLNPLSLFR